MSNKKNNKKKTLPTMSLDEAFAFNQMRTFVFDPHACLYAQCDEWLLVAEETKTIIKVLPMGKKTGEDNFKFMTVSPQDDMEDLIDRAYNAFDIPRKDLNAENVRPVMDRKSAQKIYDACMATIVGCKAGETDFSVLKALKELYDMGVELTRADCDDYLKDIGFNNRKIAAYLNLGGYHEPHAVVQNYSDEDEYMRHEIGVILQQLRMSETELDMPNLGEVMDDIGDFLEEMGEDPVQEQEVGVANLKAHLSRPAPKEKAPKP